MFIGFVILQVFLMYLFSKIKIEKGGNEMENCTTINDEGQNEELLT